MIVRSVDQRTTLVDRDRPRLRDIGGTGHERNLIDDGVLVVAVGDDQDLNGRIRVAGRQLAFVENPQAG